jgi:anti-anti-sigma factor
VALSDHDGGLRQLHSPGGAASGTGALGVVNVNDLELARTPLRGFGRPSEFGQRRRHREFLTWLTEATTVAKAAAESKLAPKGIVRLLDEPGFLATIAAHAANRPTTTNGARADRHRDEGGSELSECLHPADLGGVASETSVAAVRGRRARPAVRHCPPRLAPVGPTSKANPTAKVRAIVASPKSLSFEPARVFAAQYQGDTCVVSVDGEIDLASAPGLHDLLNTAIDLGARRLVADLSAVTFIDSSGLGVLIDCLRRLRRTGGNLIIVADREAVIRTFEVAWLHNVFRMERSLTAALRESVNA